MGLRQRLYNLSGTAQDLGQAQVKAQALPPNDDGHAQRANTRACETTVPILCDKRLIHNTHKSGKCILEDPELVTGSVSPPDLLATGNS